jgi:uncharacterized repeat protein (TIGR01451 family)
LRTTDNFFPCFRIVVTDAVLTGIRFALFLVMVHLSMFPSSVLAECACGNGDGIPTLYEPIIIDGDVAEWGTPSQAGSVIADEDNNVCDGPSGGLTDRDAPVQSTGRDIVQYTFTYDDTWLYFYTERVGSANNTQTFLYYADVDDDGYMESAEPVIVAEWQGNNRRVNIFIADYNPVDSVNGDATVDSAGYGDGYALPGNLQNISSTIGSYSGNFGTADGLSMEFAIEWTSLGFTGPVGHTIHVSSTNASKNANNLGNQIDDNLGGCGGGGGSLQYADLEFSGAYSLQGAWASTVYGLHHLVNLGNGDDAFSFAYSVTGAHTPTVSFWLDDGDLIFDGGDMPIAATVGLASGNSTNIIIVYGIGVATFGVASVTTTATSQYNPAVADTITDTIEVVTPDVITVKSVSGVSDARTFNSSNPKAIPGAAIQYSIQVSNLGNGWAATDSVYLTDTIPAGTEMFVGGGASSPVTWSGAGSGLSFSFGGLGDGGDDIAFTSDNGPSPAFTYTPAGDADGYDRAVKGFRVNPKGSFNPSTSFTVFPTVRIR